MKILFLFAALTAALPAVSRTDTLTLVFAGDVMQHLSQVEAARQSDGTYAYDTCFHYIKRYIQRADLAVANLETTLGGPPYAGYPAFRSPEAVASALQRAGFDILLTANNHSCDRGRRGIERTIRVLDSLHMAHTGTFLSAAHRSLQYPLIVSRNGFRLAFLNYTYDTNGGQVPAPAVVNLIDTVQMAADIAEAKLWGPDAIVACMHWGEEYRLAPSRDQIQLADFLLRRGVTLVVGSHPHVLQRMECRPQGRVVYSLGNFISAQVKTNTEIGAMARIRLVRRGTQVRVDDCAYTLTWVYKPVEQGRTRFYLLPAADFQTDSTFFATPDAYRRMVQSMASMRRLFAGENIGFPETSQNVLF